MNLCLHGLEPEIKYGDSIYLPPDGWRFDVVFTNPPFGTPLTLTGSVRWASEAADAEDAIRHIEGVQQIVNNLVIANVPSAAGFEPPQR